MEKYPAHHPSSLILISLLLSPLAVANSPTKPDATPSLPVEFSHEDWELACDNTRTCRAVGYQAEDMGDSESDPVAVQLTRHAGANQPVVAEVFMAGNNLPDTAIIEHKVKPFNVELNIDGKRFGKIAIDDAIHGTLSASQTNALLAAIKGTSRITFTNSNLSKQTLQWDLSNVGANAVLLKMDEVQGRVGTTGAILKKGNQPETSVLPAIPVPVILAQKIDDKTVARASDKALFASLTPQLRTIVLPTLQNDKGEEQGCMAVTDKEGNRYDEDASQWTLYRLNDKKLLATHECWTGAYNQGFGMWVINDKPPYQAELVTEDASGYADGEISAGQKSRGIGDCWWLASWVWNGTTFIKSKESTTGMCRGFAGGAVDLPTWVTRVK